MEEFMILVEGHLSAILTILVSIILVFGIVQWIAWIFCVGRFGRQSTSVGNAQALRYLVADGLVKIINDFRHLLALLIVLIFGMALAFSLWQAGGNIDQIKEVLQAVTATLGGLVGSIIGYYFGESAGKRSAASNANATPPSTENGLQPVLGSFAQAEAPYEIRPVVPPKDKQIGQETTQSGADGDNPQASDAKPS